jgi:hypothetical protein
MVEFNKKMQCYQSEDCHKKQVDVAPHGQDFGGYYIGATAREHEQPQGTRQPNQRNQEKNNQGVREDRTKGPHVALYDKCEAKGCQANREIVIDETRLERISIGESGETGRQKPRDCFRVRRARSGTHQSKRSPEKNQDGGGDSDLLGEGETKQIPEPAKDKIEENVAGLVCLEDPGRLAVDN